MTTLDVSVYDYDTFDSQCFAASGVTRMIVGSSNYAISKDIIQASRAAGIAVEDLYGFIYYGLAWESRDLDNCLKLAAELGGIKRIWLDCESGFSDNGVEDDTEAPGITVQYRLAKTIEQRNRVVAAGLEPGIYTGSYWWASKMGNSNALSDLPLWLANYGTNDPSNPREPIYYVDFGGWTEVAAHQYSSTIGLCGRPNRDHNYWFLEDDMELSKEAMVALFGSTERDDKGNLLPVELRYENAKARYQAAVESGVSLLEQVGNALAESKKRGAGGGAVPPHEHSIAATTTGIRKD